MPMRGWMDLLIIMTTNVGSKLYAIFHTFNSYINAFWYISIRALLCVGEQDKIVYQILVGEMVKTENITINIP